LQLHLVHSTYPNLTDLKQTIIEVKTIICVEDMQYYTCTRYICQVSNPKHKLKICIKSQNKTQ